MNRRLCIFLLPAVILLSACNDNGGGRCGTTGNIVVPADSVIGPEPGGTKDPDGGAPVALTISGNVSYDRLLVTAAGLDTASPANEVAQDVLVEAVAWYDLNTVFASTSTDASGDYTLNFSTIADYFIRARAQCGTAPDIDRVYHSQTSPPIVHAVPSPLLNRAAGSQTVNLHATGDLPNDRAGAFAALDTVRRLRAAASGSFASLGPLDLFWAPGNIGTRVLKNGSGQTITMTTVTGLDGPMGNPSIYLIGGSSADPLNSDHDEFDESVIAHEWASFLQLTQSRDNNFGGAHFGEELLPTAAYSEGVVTAIGLALLGTSLYRDTVGYIGGTTGLQFEFDMESGVIPGTGVGYGNEFEITRATWDLFDGGTGSPADGDGDPSNIALADFLSSFAALKTRTAPYEVAWMPSLLQQLIDDTFLNQTDANTIMTAQGAQFPPPGGADPFPALLIVGAAATSGMLDAWSGTDPNSILGPQANGVFRLELAATQSVTIDVTNTTAGYSSLAHRLDLTVHDLERNILGQSVGGAPNKTVALNLTAGTYIIRVQHLPASQAGSMPVTFTVQAQ
ncbi:MAG: hypothetical protein KDB90_05360 [Planctomycetes bacterium]|nr:hypothetical protein [Planctomycetota bacterium]